MKTLYLDIFSGISGDMFIGALLDLGVDFSQLEKNLKALQLDGYHLHVKRGEKMAISGTKFDVHDHDHDHGGHESEGKHSHHHEHSHTHTHTHTHSHGGLSHAHPHSHAHGRTYADIQRLIDQSHLSDWVKKKALAVFQRIAVAEGKIHGVPAQQVHFHEVGAIDSIIDIVGACIALEMLGKPRVLAGPVLEGRGWIQCAHGRFPIPAPATLEILSARGVSITQTEEPHELITPTGAALLAEFCESFGPLQGFAAEKVGFGLGTRDNKSRPNVLRAMLGTAHASPDLTAGEVDTIAVIESNLDDISPEILGAAMESALAAGALDAFFTPIQMKKNRPAVLLTLLVPKEKADSFAQFLLTQTSAFGVRITYSERRKLRREFTEVHTPFGAVKVKLGKLKETVVQRSPEFESCKELAAKAKVPVKTVYEAAIAALGSLS